MTQTITSASPLWEQNYLLAMMKLAKSEKRGVVAKRDRPTIAASSLSDRSIAILRASAKEGGFPVDASLAVLIGVKTQALHNEVCRLTTRNLVKATVPLSTKHPRILHITDEGADILRQVKP